jgi:hypothetical protein
MREIPRSVEIMGPESPSGRIAMPRKRKDMPAGTIGFEVIIGDEDWMRPAPAALSF